MIFIRFIRLARLYVIGSLQSLRNIKFNLGNLENLNKIMVQITYNLNKIKVQTSMANGHFGLIYSLSRNHESIKIKKGNFLVPFYITF